MVPDLIYDVGIHDGEDTAYYLHKGYRVVAIDADPIMVEACRERFHNEISSGKLVLLNLGIAPRPGNLRFWLHKHNRVWSSFRWNPEWAENDCDSVDVACVPFREILHKYGVPYYLKVDIEGADGLCLRDLDAVDLPKYISFEAGPTSFYGACFLASLGYNAFKLVDQTTHDNPNFNYSNERHLQRWKRQVIGWKWAVTKKLGLDTSWLAKIWHLGRKLAAPVAPHSMGSQNVGWVFGAHSSGPFGEESPGSWRPLEEVAYDWFHRRFGYTDRGTLSRSSWYDWHATRIEGYPNCATFFELQP